MPVKLTSKEGTESREGVWEGRRDGGIEKRTERGKRERKNKKERM